MIVNVAALALTFNATSRVVSTAFYGSDDYLLAEVVSALIAVAGLLMHRMHRYGEQVGAVGVTILFGISASVATVLFGLESQVQSYFVLAGLAWFLFGLERWRLVIGALFSLTVTVLGLLVLAPRQGAAVSSATVGIIAIQSTVNAIAINAVMLFYALHLLQRAEADLERQTGRAEALLSVVLPATVADRLRAAPEKPIADRIDGASILFADLEGFTRAAHMEKPEAVVAYLDRLVREFDGMCERLGVEKIKSIGDAYMAAGGLQGVRQDGAIAIGRLALAMLEYLECQPPLGTHRLRLRIGVHAGSAIAGVIGDTRITYDLWGDAVNVASRMESHGVPGRIHVSDAYRRLVGDAFRFEMRGETEIKGIGAAHTFFLIGPA